jgi:hypothetical protein
LATKAERLVTFGEEPKLWYELLRPVLENFVRSFDAPDGAETKDFWQKIAKWQGGSGMSYLNVSCRPLTFSIYNSNEVNRDG